MPLVEVKAAELGACSGKAGRQQNEKIKALEEREDARKLANVKRHQCC